MKKTREILFFSVLMQKKQQQKRQYITKLFIRLNKWDNKKIGGHFKTSSSVRQTILDLTNIATLHYHLAWFTTNLSATPGSF